MVNFTEKYKKMLQEQIEVQEGRILDSLIPSKDLMKVIKMLDNDKQSIDLLKKIYDVFESKFSAREKGALNRLVHLMNNPLSPDVLRNQIFKVANDLGIKLPSSMF